MSETDDRIAVSIAIVSLDGSRIEQLLLAYDANSSRCYVRADDNLWLSPDQWRDFAKHVDELLARMGV